MGLVHRALVNVQLWLCYVESRVVRVRDARARVVRRSDFRLPVSSAWSRGMIPRRCSLVLLTLVQFIELAVVVHVSRRRCIG